MLGSPPDIDGNDVVTAIQGVDGVVDVHHVHLWQMQEHAAALDCHIVVERERMGEADKIKENVKSVLHERFSIEHSTLEFEASDNAHQDAQVFGHRS
jgi:cobalt-zinc-cadmium efflux system protein